MSATTICLKTFALGGVVAFSMASGSLAYGRDSSMSRIDANHDGSISLQEAHDAAANKFDKLDKEHTGKLTEKQVSPMSKAIREMARHDKDHTIDKDEYMAGVDAAFKEADPKGTGMLDTKALKTKAGRHFLELVE